MPKVLIVGINGFAGQYLKRELLNNGYDVYGADLASNDSHTFAADMLLPEAVDRVVEEIQPEGIFNLSGFASPHLSWTHILDTLHLNIDISVNLALSMQRHCPNARLLVIGSSNQYDVEACQGRPIDENAPLKSDDPYSISKQAQEGLLLLLAQKLGLDIMLTRSFNHIGPGQKKGFVVSDFASGIVNVERGKAPALTVGNLKSWRDFSDVRDTVRAYRLLYEKGHPGEIYNVGSGKAYMIEGILEKLISFSPVEVPVIRRSAKSTSSGGNKMICDYGKLRAHTGYMPERNLEDTLLEVLEYYRQLPETP